MLNQLRHYRELKGVSVMTRSDTFIFNSKSNFVSSILSRGDLTLSKHVDGFLDEMKYYDTTQTREIHMCHTDLEKADSDWMKHVCSVFPNVEEFNAYFYIGQEGFCNVLRSFPKLKRIRFNSFTLKNMGRETLKTREKQYVIIDDDKWDEIVNSGVTFTCMYNREDQDTNGVVFVKNSVAQESIETYLEPAIENTSNDDY